LLLNILSFKIHSRVSSLFFPMTLSGQTLWILSLLDV